MVAADAVSREQKLVEHQLCKKLPHAIYGVGSALGTYLGIWKMRAHYSRNLPSRRPKSVSIEVCDHREESVIDQFRYGHQVWAR